MQACWSVCLEALNEGVVNGLLARIGADRKISVIISNARHRESHNALDRLSDVFALDGLVEAWRDRRLMRLDNLSNPDDERFSFSNGRGANVL